MAADLLDGFEHLDHDHAYGGTYEADVPWRFVAHTTEAVPSTVAGARNMALRHPNPPHLWVWPEEDWRAQTVLLSRSAFALLHPRGTPHTNKMRAIQVEIIGYAKDSPHKPAEWWAWLGANVLAPVIAAGYPIDLSNIAPLTGPDGYGVHGAVRMSRSAWRHFGGVCSHSNVPDNAHWDIGDGRLDLVARAAGGRPPTPLEDDMTPAQEAALHAKLDRTLLSLTRIENDQHRRILQSLTRVENLHFPRVLGQEVDLSDDDIAGIAALVLSGLDAAGVARAVPEDLAEQVVDELARLIAERLAG